MEAREGYQFVGLQKGYGTTAETVYVHCKGDTDCLPADLWQYLGERPVTPKQLRAMRRELLAAINSSYGKAFRRFVVVA